ncbi:pyridoxal phosphate-dependent decarboxylase family protein [Brucella pecoris]|uniref:Glutamate/tyrosine decarboxylase-like PLP-dependent enzyme n=1 Tax=Brucella pecoris TaxID=867683 RepID=A0A5C5CL42_9HYPH|nr:pyridoxal-dependent decarboxylase [Brucella pecoris]MBB4094342.1 glutamate/tyrosine decarboxylase-like PLP-dependent enzyme [Brucella pecoris]TNV12008.1 hypothetical protein FIB18_11215 [Brucella pecoris]
MGEKQKYFYCYKESLISLKSMFQPSPEEKLQNFIEEGICFSSDNQQLDLDATSVWGEIPESGKSPSEALKDALQILTGQHSWHSPNVLFNITPAPLPNAVAAVAISSLYNGNALWDFVSGNTLELERHIIEQIAALAKLPSNQAGGAFTSGGRSCINYAIRLGLNRCVPGISSTGLESTRAPVVFTSEVNHYSVEHACSLLGLGRSAAVRIPGCATASMDLDLFHRKLREAIDDGTPIAAIIASGGNAMDLAIDPLAEMQSIIDFECDRANLSYRPFVYFDTVVGWAWFSYFDYDFDNNPLKLPEPELHSIKKFVSILAAVSGVDGFGCDFHKTALTPISSSCFIARDQHEFRSVLKDEVSVHDWQPYGNNFVHHYTIEHTRPTGPIAAAWTSLQTLGLAGIRSYLARLMELSRRFKEAFRQTEFEILNDPSIGLATAIYPKNLAAAPTFQALLELTADEIEASNRFVFHLFDELAHPVDGGEAVVLRYLPQMNSTRSKAPAGSLVVYPMSVQSADADIDRLVGRILEVYRRLLKEGVSRPLRFNPPAHVPR